MTPSQVTDLVRALAWPVVVLLAVIAFRKQLAAAASVFGGRVSKISVAGVGVEFAGVQGVDIGGSQLLAAIRDPIEANAFQARAGFPQQSGTGTLKNLIRSGERTDYAIIDLGEGQRWLSSRLYIFAAMLRWSLRVREFAFVETAGGFRGRFVGKASTSSICLALGDRFPWLWEAFNAASFNTPLGIYSGYPNPSGQRQLPGEPDDAHAILIIEAYLRQLQAAVAPPHEERDWVELSTKGVAEYEHARWITPDFIESLLQQALDREYVTVTLKTSPEDQARQAIAAHGQYVACIDEDHRLKSLLDRMRIAEAVARRGVR